jgi:hypothetical protein
MKAIVIVFMPSRYGQVSSEQTTSRDNRAGGLEVVSYGPKTDLPRLSKSDQTTPPFWTWFVENPRRAGV